MTVLGVIPARAGSKGLPGKNLKPLGGIPLIGWTIRAARESRLLSTTWVSTEDAEIAEIAKSLGGEVPFVRPRELAQDDSSIFAVLRHAVGEFERRTERRPEVIVLLQPTTPFRAAQDIDAAIELIVREGADSAQTVTEDMTHPFHRFLIRDGRLVPMFPETERVSRRQEAPKAYRPNGGVYAAKTAILLEHDSLIGRDHRPVVMDFESSIDIDHPWDFQFAEALLAGRNAGLTPPRKTNKI